MWITVSSHPQYGYWSREHGRRLRKKEFMEGGVSQHGGGSHGGAYYTDLEVAEFLKAVSGNEIF